MKKTITIATRESALALWQSEYVAALITAQTGHPTRLLPMTTEGDQRLEVSLNKIGGKGLFLKELEQAMLSGAADIAVHSMKDVPAALPEGFALGAVFPREDPSDAFVSNKHGSLSDLPDGALVGTSSLRRQAQVLAVRPDLKILPLRGNVNTRLRKLDEGQYDAIILASAGLIRLGFDDRIADRMVAPSWLPAVSQGVVGVEFLSDREDLMTLFKPLNDPGSWACIQAERAMNAKLNGSCSAAIGAQATRLADDSIRLHGAVFSPDGTQAIRAKQQAYDPIKLGEAVAEDLLAQGATDVLALSA